MAKFCPECGCELEGNEKSCPECGINLDFKTDSGASKSAESKQLLLRAVPFIIIVAVIIGAVLLFGGNFNSGENILITVSETGEWISSYDNNYTISYYYYVNGYISGIPSDAGKYFIKTIYYDSNGTEVGNTVENLGTIHYGMSESDPHSLSSFFPNNQVDVDHIIIQVIKDNKVIKEFDESFDTNNVQFSY